MAAKIILALALLILAVAAVPTFGGLGEDGQAASGYDGNMGTGGGNLVPRW